MISATSNTGHTNLPRVILQALSCSVDIVAQMAESEDGKNQGSC